MREEIINRLGIDPGQLTIGQLLQDREAARIELQRLHRELEVLRSSVTARTSERSSDNSDAPQSAGSVLIGIGDLCKRLGVSRASIYRWVNEGTFPPAVRISTHAVRWRIEDVEKWRASLSTT